MKPNTLVQKDKKLKPTKNAFVTIPMSSMFPSLTRQTDGTESSGTVFLNEDICLEEYSSIKTTIRNAQLLLEFVEDRERVFLQVDPYVQKRSTAEGLMHLMKLLTRLADYLERVPNDERSNVYFLLYDSSIVVVKYEQLLRNFWYTSDIVEILKKFVSLLDHSSILSASRFLEWRLKLHLIITRLISRGGQHQQAIQYLKTECTRLETVSNSSFDIPSERRLILDGILLLQKLLFKLELQNGFIDVSKLKENVERRFKSPETMVAALVESLESEEIKESGLHSHKGSQMAWRKQAVAFVESLVYPATQLLVTSLEAKEQCSKLDVSSATYETNRLKLMTSVLSERQERGNSDLFPLKLHLMYLRHCYECKETKTFEKMLLLAQRRIRVQAFEKPYLMSVTFIVTKEPTIPSLPEYQVKSQDLNEPYLLQELKRIETFPDHKIIKSDSDPRFHTSKGVTYTMSDLLQTDHRFVYLATRTTLDPLDAIVDLEVVIADEEEGPVGHVKSGFICQPIPINLYTGVQASTHKIPFLCTRTARHLRSGPVDGGLQSYVSEVNSIIETWADVRPSVSFRKIQIDLRQTPIEFLKLSNLHYTFLEVREEENIELNFDLVELCQRLEKAEAEEAEHVERSKESDQKTVLDRLSLHVAPLTLESIIKVSVKIGEELRSQKCRDHEQELVFRGILVNVWSRYLWPSLLQLSLYRQATFHQFSVPDLDEAINSLSFLTSSDFDHFIDTFLHILQSDKVHFDVFLYTRVIMFKGRLLESEGKVAEAAALFKRTKRLLDQQRAWRHDKKLRGDEETIFAMDVSTSQFRVNKCLRGMQFEIKEWIERSEVSMLEDEGMVQRDETLYLSSDTDSQTLTLTELRRMNQLFLNEEHNIGRLLESRALSSHRTTIGEREMLLNSLRLDLFINYSRCRLEELKQIRSEERETRVTSKVVRFQRMFDLLARTREEVRGPEMARAMQEKMGHLRPNLTEAERELLDEAKENHYERAVHLTSIASFQENGYSMKCFLGQAVEEVRKASEYEQSLFAHCVGRASEVAGAFDVDYLCSNFGPTDFPLSLSSLTRSIDSVSKVPSPTLLKLSGQSVVLRLPSFQLTDPSRTLDDEPVFGLAIKEVSSSTKESVTSLDHLFTKRHETSTCEYVFSQDSLTSPLVSVVNLKKNKKYTFAAALPQSSIKSVAVSPHHSPEIIACQPLPIANIALHIAKSGHLFEKHDQTNEALDIALEDFLVEDVDQGSSPFHSRKLNTESLETISLIDHQYVVEALLLKGLSEVAGLSERVKGDKAMTVDKKKMLLFQSINLLVLSSEVAAETKLWSHASSALTASFNYLSEFLQGQEILPVLLNPLLRLYSVSQALDSNYIYGHLTESLTRVVFTLLRVCHQNGEFELYKRILYQETRRRTRMVDTLSVGSPGNRTLSLRQNIRSQLELFLSSTSNRLLNFVMNFHTDFQRQLDEMEVLGDTQALSEETSLFFDLLTHKDDLTFLKNSLVGKRTQSPLVCQLLCEAAQDAVARGETIQWESLKDCFKEQMVEGDKEAWGKGQVVLELMTKAVAIDLEWEPTEYFSRLEFLSELDKWENMVTEELKESQQSEANEQPPLDKSKSKKMPEVVRKKTREDFYPPSTTMFGIFLRLRELSPTLDTENLYPSLHSKDTEGGSLVFWGQLQIIEAKGLFAKVIARHGSVIKGMSDTLPFHCNLSQLTFAELGLEVNSPPDSVPSSTKLPSTNSTFDDDRLRLYQSLLNAMVAGLISGSYLLVHQSFELALSCLRTVSIPLGETRVSITSLMVMHFNLFLEKLKSSPLRDLGQRSNVSRCQEEVQRILGTSLKGKFWWERVGSLHLPLVADVLAPMVHSLVHSPHSNILQWCLQKFLTVSDNFEGARLFSLLESVFSVYCERQSYALQLERERSTAEDPVALADTIDKLKWFEGVRDNSKNSLSMLKKQQKEVFEKMHWLIERINKLQREVISGTIDPSAFLSEGKAVFYEVRVNVIEELRKQSEFDALVLIQYRLGSFLLLLGDIDNAQKYLIDSVDSTLQLFDVIRKLPEHMSVLRSEFTWTKATVRALHLSLSSIHVLSSELFVSHTSHQTSCLILASLICQRIMSHPTSRSLTDLRDFPLPNVDFLHWSYLRETTHTPVASLIDSLSYFCHASKFLNCQESSFSIYRYLHFLLNELSDRTDLLLLTSQLRIEAYLQMGKVRTAFRVFRSLATFSLCYSTPVSEGKNNCLEDQVPFCYEPLPDFNDDLSPFDERNKKSIELLLNSTPLPVTQCSSNSRGVLFKLSPVTLFVNKTEGTSAESDALSAPDSKFMFVKSLKSQLDANCISLLSSLSSSFSSSANPITLELFFTWLSLILSRQTLVKEVYAHQNLECIEYSKIRELYLMAVVKVNDFIANVILSLVHLLVLRHLEVHCRLVSLTLSEETYRTIFDSIAVLMPMTVDDPAHLKELLQVSVNHLLQIQIMNVEIFELLNLPKEYSQSARQLLQTVERVYSGDMYLKDLALLISSKSSPSTGANPKSQVKNPKPQTQLPSQGDLSRLHIFLTDNTTSLSAFIHETQRPLSFYNSQLLSAKFHCLKSIYKESRFTLVVKLASHVAEICHKVGDIHYSPLAEGLSAKAMYFLCRPEESLRRMRAVTFVEEAVESSSEAVEFLGDLSEIELLHDCSYSSFRQLMRAKSKVVLGSEYLGQLTRRLETSKVITRVLGDSPPKSTPIDLDDLTSQNQHLIDLLASLKLSDPPRRPDLTRLRLFIELQEVNSEVEQMFSAGFFKESTKEKNQVNKIKDRKGDKANVLQRPLPSYFSLVSEDLASEHKYNQVYSNELSQNRRETFPSIYNRWTLLNIHLNLRAAQTVLRAMEVNSSCRPSLISDKYLQCLAVVERLLLENTILLSKNYHVSRVRKSLNEFLLGKVLRQRSVIGARLKSATLAQISLSKSISNANVKVDLKMEILNAQAILRGLSSEFLPNVTLLRHYPSFQHFLLEETLPLLKEADEHFDSALVLLSEEPVFFDMGHSLREVILEASRTKTLLGTWSAPLTFRLLSPTSIVRFASNFGVKLSREQVELVCVEEQRKFEGLKQERIKEGVQLLKQVLVADKCQKRISNLELVIDGGSKAVQDPETRLPLEIYQMAVMSRQFEETRNCLDVNSKSSNSITSSQLIAWLSKLVKQVQCFTFSESGNMVTYQKTHKWLLLNDDYKRLYSQGGQEDQVIAMKEHDDRLMKEGWLTVVVPRPVLKDYIGHCVLGELSLNIEVEVEERQAESDIVNNNQNTVNLKKSVKEKEQVVPPTVAKKIVSLSTEALNPDFREKVLMRQVVWSQVEFTQLVKDVFSMQLAIQETKDRSGELSEEDLKVFRGQLLVVLGKIAVSLYEFDKQTFDMTRLDSILMKARDPVIDHLEFTEQRLDMVFDILRNHGSMIEDPLMLYYVKKVVQVIELGK